jgi:TorA maturation chaperone TorD
MSQGRMPLAHLARFREATYRLLSQTFLYPDEECLREAAAAASELRREGVALARFAFFDRWSELLRFVEGLSQRETAKIQQEFVPLFLVNPQGVPCPPYESVYRDPTGWPTGWLLAEVEREYAAAGLAPSPDLGELPDHVAVELEFIAVLCGREAQAWEEESLSLGIGALRRQKAFLDSHLALWLPGFARQVTAAVGGGVYAVISQGAEVFVSHDRDLIGTLAETLPAGCPGLAEVQAPFNLPGEVSL